jgi:hypothetical protein
VVCRKGGVKGANRGAGEPFVTLLTGIVTACYGNVTLRMVGKWLVVNIVTPVTLVHPQKYKYAEMLKCLRTASGGNDECRSSNDERRSQTLMTQWGGSRVGRLVLVDPGSLSAEFGVRSAESGEQPRNQGTKGNVQVQMSKSQRNPNGPKLKVAAGRLWVRIGPLRSLL